MPRDRPLTLGILLREVFRQFSRNLLAVGLLEGFSLLSTVVSGLVFVALAGASSLQSLVESGPPSLPRAFWGPLLLTLVLWAYLHCAGAAGFIRWTADGMQGRGERSVRVLVRAGLAGGAVLFLIMVLYGVAILGMTTLITWMGLVLGPLNPLIRLSASLFALFVIVYVSLIISLSLASAVLGGHGPVEALRRSDELAKGHRVRLLGLYAILGALAFGVVLLSMVATASLETVGHLEVVGSLLAIILQGASVSLFLLASTVAYVRLRPVEALSLSIQEAPAAVLDFPAQSERAEGEAPVLFRHH